MPVIRISDATFVDLKSLSTWLGTATPSETISAVIQEKMEALDLERDVDEETASPYKKTSDKMIFKKTPGLTHTRILSATINGKKLNNPNWSSLLIETCLTIKKNKGFSAEQLSIELQIPAQPSKITERGYKFYSKLGISIQGQSATDAWKEIARLTQKFEIPLEVKFQWREKNGAQYPGKVGFFRTGFEPVLPP